ncbi:hypothetical protein HDU97_006036 [Phlyctochytrium planicorne]|nr:hypothetical protein HDU97_006036 [Phlyctochytrium planicorne]
MPSSPRLGGRREQFAPRDADAERIRISDSDLQSALRLANNVKPELEAARSKMIVEKEILHAKSMESVKAWTNTIMGQRKKRLAAREEQQRLLESEREKIDADWTLTRNKERQNAVDRARLMQYVETSRVRQLHARLLMSNVLFERESQLKYKEEMRAAEKAESGKHVHQSMNFTPESEKSHLTEHQKRQIRRLISQDLRRDTEEKAKEAQAKRLIERRHQSDLDKMVAKEIEAEVAKEKEEKLKRIIDMKRGLDEGLKTKMECQNLIHEQERSLDKANERFNDMKTYIANKKKDIEKKRAMNLSLICDKVSDINLKMNKERYQKVQNFIDAMGRAHFGDSEEREAADRLRRKAVAAEIEAFRLQKLREKEEALERQRAEAANERLKMTDEFSVSNQEEKRRLEKAKADRMALKSFHKKQMDEARKQSDLLKEENKHLNSHVLQTLNDENDRFYAYAMEAVNEFKNAGKNVVPIIRGLRSSKPFPPITTVLKQDTFERLGFTSMTEKRQLRNLIEQKLVRSGEKDK